MAEEDEVARPRRMQSLNLDPLGIGELHDYIAELQAEILRCEAAIAKKKSHRSAADSFFKA